jgi:hypothetical protein
MISSEVAKPKSRDREGGNVLPTFASSFDVNAVGDG